MLKIVLFVIAALYAALCIASVEVNKADAAELDGIKGIGPALSGKILDERKKGSFKDWNDLISRIKGMGQANAVRLSAQGLTVNDAAYRQATVESAASAAQQQ
ncbi:MAG: ComEA family DNA-binding protein [Rhodoferax sp.]